MILRQDAGLSAPLHPHACRLGAKAVMALPLLALFLPGTSALDSGVGRTPIMGFDAW